VQDLVADAPWRPTRRPIFQSEQQSMHTCNATVDPMHMKKGEDEKVFEALLASRLRGNGGLDYAGQIRNIQGVKWPVIK
jgi:hypothetical protein